MFGICYSQSSFKGYQRTIYFIFLLFPVALYAQVTLKDSKRKTYTISGYVTDKASGENLLYNE